MQWGAMGSNISNFYYFNMLAKLDEKFRPLRNMQIKV